MQKASMKRLAGKAEPTADQIEKWTPDKVIPDLLAVKGKVMTKPVPLNEHDVKCCLLKVKAIIAEEPSLLHVAAPQKIVGDIHGQFLRRL